MRYIVLAGRQTAHDIAAFTRLSADARVETLGPNDFPNRVVDSGAPWFVDFFAPVSVVSMKVHMNSMTEYYTWFKHILLITRHNKGSGRAESYV